MKGSFNNKKLQSLIKAISDAAGVKARVGILGSKTSRNEGLATNAFIGAIHEEFGDAAGNIRSFLRVPITEHLQEFLDSSKAFDEAALRKVLEEQSVIEWLKKLGITAEAVVKTAFATGGFGKWKASNMARKKVHMTLVETQQLRNSITSEVK